MDAAIEILSVELDLMENKIRTEKGNNMELIDKKNQILQAINCLNRFKDFDIDLRKDKIIRLKDIGYCAYRLLVDDETDKRDSWIEISLDENDAGLKLSGGDILIVKK